MKGLLSLLIIKVLIAIILGIGWIKCIVKAVKCDWEPNYKAEVIYTIGSVIPAAGGIIGWTDIEDIKSN